MSCDLDSDSFHGTKKFGRRKTVSKRRAYVNTPSQRKKALSLIVNALSEVSVLKDSTVKLRLNDYLREAISLLK
jgi:hypothetical protein